MYLNHLFAREVLIDILFQILTLGQEPYENIEHMKSTSRSFLKVLEDYKLCYAYSMLNFYSAFLQMLKLLSIFLKRKIKFAFVSILTKFSTQILNTTV